MYFNKEPWKYILFETKYVSIILQQQVQKPLKHKSAPMTSLIYPYKAQSALCSHSIYLYKNLNIRSSSFVFHLFCF